MAKDFLGSLSWELKVAAEESQKLFLQEIEASFIA